MPNIKKNIQLKPYNTFGVEATASYFSSCKQKGDFETLWENPEFQDTPGLILGGGSNILFTQDFNGLVIKNDIRGIESLEETQKHIIIRVGAGENWDNLVAYTVKQGWGGLENLSYIPGNVGACPIQNIGAYGVEVKNTIVSVETLDAQNLKEIDHSKDNCRFGYRSSIFKTKLRGKRIITHVIFRLTKKDHHYTLNYGNLEKQVYSRGSVNLETIREAVIEIRKSKLPEPEEIGSAGSFFKNPVVDKNQYLKLQAAHPGIPSYPMEGERVKIPAGWMIDQLGWKGYREGDAAVHSKQALVLINCGNATGRQIYELSKKIRESVQSEFGIELEYEVNIL